MLREFVGVKKEGQPGEGGISGYAGISPNNKGIGKAFRPKWISR